MEILIENEMNSLIITHELTDHRESLFSSNLRDVKFELR